MKKLLPWLAITPFVSFMVYAFVHSVELQVGVAVALVLFLFIWGTINLMPQ